MKKFILFILVITTLVPEQTIKEKLTDQQTNHALAFVSIVIIAAQIFNLTNHYASLFQQRNVCEVRWIDGFRKENIFLIEYFSVDVKAQPVLIV